jgi:nicotinate dehydrogenase subunit A
MSMSIVVLKVNGQIHRLDIDPAIPLLYILRNQLALNGPKFGCGMQQCGACMVLIDGKAQYSCTMPVSMAQRKAITTLEGLATAEGKLHPVQQSFLDEQAAQCGYCLNGMVISAVSLLNTSTHLDDAAIRKGMQPVLCRCGSQARVLRAIKHAVSTANK